MQGLDNRHQEIDTQLLRLVQDSCCIEVDQCCFQIYLFQEYICRKSAESKSGRDDSSRMIKGGGVRILPPLWKEDVTQQK